jgi:branched-chain amino acid transport system permease protein
MFNKENKYLLQVKSILKHPYSGFIIAGLVFLLIQVLYFNGLIGISMARAFGLTMIYSIVALGFSILLGYAGLASLGTAGFIGLGTYFLGYFTNAWHLPFGLSLLVSIIGAVILGAIVGFISLRIEGMYLAIITLGLSEILSEVFKRATTFTNGTNGLTLKYFALFMQIFTREMVYQFIIFVFIIMMILTYNIIKSPTGRAMLAIKNSDSAAQAMGINILKYRLLAFVLSTVYAVIGGILYMGYWEFSVPTSWSLALSLNILAAVIVGGSRSIYGIILGVFMIFGLNQAFLQQISFFQQHPDITLIFNGLLIIVVVMFYPGGLIRLLQSLKYRLVNFSKKLIKKWKEYRYGTDME